MSDNEIQKAAEELFKDSEYPVPNIYCFTEGAKWALVQVNGIFSLMMTGTFMRDTDGVGYP